MTTQNDVTRDEAEIRRVMESWAKAIRGKDVEALVTHYTPDVLVFDLAPPLQHAGKDVQRRNFEEWFASFRGPVGFEMRDLEITSGDGVAFAHSLNRITGERTSGEDTDVWVRATVCLRKIGGTWLVAHEHASVPFYMDGSGKAAVDLAP